MKVKLRKKKTKKFTKKQKKKERAEFIKERKLSLAMSDDGQGDGDREEAIAATGSGISEEIPSTDDDDEFGTGKLRKNKDTIKNILKRKKSVSSKKNSNKIDKIDENDETSDEENSYQIKQKASTANKKRRQGGGEKKRPQTVEARFVSTAPMAHAGIMDLEEKFATLGFGSDNDGDDESDMIKARTPAWHDSINWGHSSPLGNELYGNSFDDNNRPSVSRANLWGSMDGAAIGEFAMSVSLEDAFPDVTSSLQADIDEQIDKQVQLFEKRAITASSTTRSAGVISLEQDGMNNNGNKKNRPLTSASMVDLHGDGGTATIQPTDFVRPNTAAQFPSWHYED